MSSQAALLDGLRVLEIGDEPAVRFCGWLFALNGASVHRVGERPANDDYAGQFLDTAKLVVAEQGAENWDIIIADPSHSWESVSGLSVTGTVHQFRPGGPYGDWVGSEIVYSSMGGASGYTLTRDGVPVYGYGDRYQYIAGMHLFQGLCAKLIQRLDLPPVGNTGHPMVEVSNFETVVTTLPYPTTQYQYNGDESVLEQSGPRFVSKCSDGFIVVYAGFAWAPIATMLDRADLLTDERFVDNGARFSNVTALGEVIDDWAAQRNVAEACDRGKAQNVAVTPVRPPAEALADEGLRRRRSWIYNDPGTGQVPALPYTVDGQRVQFDAKELV